MRVGSFFPFFRTTYTSTATASSSKKELKRAQIGFRKTEHASSTVTTSSALQGRRPKLTPQHLRKTARYWTLILEPKFSPRSASNQISRRFTQLPD